MLIKTNHSSQNSKGDIKPADNLKLMCILAHPDDELLGVGGVLAKYAVYPCIETKVFSVEELEYYQFFDFSPIHFPSHDISTKKTPALNQLTVTPLL